MIKMCARGESKLFLRSKYVGSPVHVHSALLPVASGGGNAETFSLPEIGKIVVENWCYLLWVYTFRVEAELQEIFSKKL